MKKIKFWDEMDFQERKDRIKGQIESYKKRKWFDPKPELDLAIDFFNKNDLETASECLINLSERYLIYIHDKFEEFIKNLHIPSDVDLERNIKKRFFEHKHPRIVRYKVISLISNAIRSNKLDLNDEEKWIIDEFGGEYT